MKHRVRKVFLLLLFVLTCMINEALSIDLSEDNVLVCKPALPLSNSSFVLKDVPIPGKKGPKGDRGLPGLPGTTNNSEIERLERRIDEINELLWMVLRHYRVDTVPRNWNDARAFCQSIGADLVTEGMRNPVKRRYIIEQLVRPLAGSFYWIGLTDLSEEGTWTWIDGVAMTAENSNFHPGEPNNVGGGPGGSDCAHIHRGYDYLMDDHACQNKQYAICEWKCSC